MPTVGDDLTLCQRYLRDTAGAVWPRAELLLWYEDGYRRLLAASQGVRTFTVLPIPPHYTMAHTAPWEKRYPRGGSTRQVTQNMPGTTRQCTYTWEAERASGIATPAAAQSCVTQLWELAYIDATTDADYRFAFPRNHERIKALWYDHKPIAPIATRTLDQTEQAWSRSSGEPLVYVPGFGEARSIEVYHIRTTYTADYAYQGGMRMGIVRTLSGSRTYDATGSTLRHGYAYTTQADSLFLADDAPRGLHGAGIRITGDPTPSPGAGYQCLYLWETELHTGATPLTDADTTGTYAWEADYGATNVTDYAIGLLRTLDSPERQYVPHASWAQPVGLIRTWASSEGNLLLHETVIPDVPTLTDADVPTMIPAPLQKYLRYFVLSSAFARIGEGFRPDLSAHWYQRWSRGATLLRKLADSTWADARHQRDIRRPEHAGRLSRHAPLGPDYGEVRI